MLDAATLIRHAALLGKPATAPGELFSFEFDEIVEQRPIMEWKDIKTQADADALMEIFGGFHDGCIREAHLATGSYVNPDLSMYCCPGLDNDIRFLIQRQFENPAAIELLFEPVIRFNLVPARENYDSIIMAATLLVQSDSIYWSPEGDSSPDKQNRDDFTWVSARRLRWREVAWLGKELRYGPGQNEKHIGS